MINKLLLESSLTLLGGSRIRYNCPVFADEARRLWCARVSGERQERITVRTVWQILPKPVWSRAARTLTQGSLSLQVSRLWSRILRHDQSTWSHGAAYWHQGVPM